ncbi:MAG: hypothetical protein II984_03585 [Clostridia bacterium]|nr:hypothetical protein [Clostridia bacterium]
MNKFSVLVKKQNNYIVVDGNTVFPLNFANLLDEQLDEAHLIIRNSKKKIYDPLTEFKIELKQDDIIVKELYLVLAQDKPREFPTGSNFYVHDLYLIERTKLLEGICCQSTTFTNVLKRNYTKYPYGALSYFYFDAKGHISNEYDGFVRKELEQEYTTPLLKNSTVTIIQPMDIAMKAIAILHMNNETDTELSLVFNECTASYSYDNSEEKQLLCNETATINFNFNLVIKYRITLAETQKIAGILSAKQSHIDIYYNIAGVENKHPLKPWSIADCINRVLEIAEPKFWGEIPTYTLNTIQAEKFDKIKAPEFTMTQCTLREQLKIIGSYIHAEPRLGGYDENGIYQENWIFFDEYGTGEQASLANAPYIYKGNSTDISQYCTDIQTNASNIVNSLNYAQGVIIDPDSTNTQTLRTESINVKLTESNSRVSTILPIYKITKVECGLYDDEGNWIVEPKDITSYVFEAHEYHSTLSSYGGTYPYAKCYAIYYTQGQNDIDGLFFKSDNADDSMWENYAISNILASVNGMDATDLNSKVESNFPTLAFRVSYLPIYDAKFSHNKQLIIPTNKRFSLIYNQSENLIETSYYGENIKGVAQRLGNVEQTRTYMLSDISQIPKAGQMLDGYVISAVTTEIMPFYIKCTVALSNDFNRISQYVGINSNKRISEVSERQAYKRDILLKDYVVFTDDASKYTKRPIAFGNYNAIRGTFDYVASPEVTPVTSAICSHLNYNGETINGTSVKLPVISSSFGNSILFSWKYKDNYSAGEQVFKGEQYQIIDGNKEKITAYWQTDVPYCDYYGKIYYYMFSLFNNISDLGLNQAKTVNYEIKNSSNLSYIMTNKEYILRKDSREALSVNYEVEMVTDQEDIIIGSALAKNNPLVTNEHGVGQIYFFDKPIGKFENKIDISKALNINNPVNMSVSLTENKIIVNFVENLDFQSYAIVTQNRTGETVTYEDEQGNISQETETYGGELLLARNKPKKAYRENATSDSIYFVATSNPYNE